MKTLENELLSADTLFNFTPKLEFLLSKIEYRFKPRLVLEKYQPFGIDFEQAFPMVCFCDIRLSDISTHVKEYGEYGIGLKKEWGIKKGINPLIYISSEHSTILDLFTEIIVDKHSDVKDLAARLFLHFKPYSGIQGECYRNFYNEREWRYIPNEGKIISLPKEKFNNEPERESMNQELFEKKTLDFTFNDIKYIILKEEAEKDIISMKIAEVFSINIETVYKEICFLTKKLIEKDL